MRWGYGRKVPREHATVSASVVLTHNTSLYTCTSPFKSYQTSVRRLWSGCVRRTDTHQLLYSHSCHACLKWSYTVHRLHSPHITMVKYLHQKALRLQWARLVQKCPLSYFPEFVNHRRRPWDKSWANWECSPAQHWQGCLSFGGSRAVRTDAALRGLADAGPSAAEVLYWLR